MKVEMKSDHIHIKKENKETEFLFILNDFKVSRRNYKHCITYDVFLKEHPTEFLNIGIIFFAYPMQEQSKKDVLKGKIRGETRIIVYDPDKNASGFDNNTIATIMKIKTLKDKDSNYMILKKKYTFYQ